jgi:hypothetical protein
MKTRRALLPVAAVVAVAALGATRMVHGAPAASASSSASSRPSASASSPAAAAPVPLRGASIPTDPTPAPKGKEWTSATPVLLDIKACRGLLLREWLRVSCTGFIGAGLAAGNPKDAQAWGEIERSPIAAPIVRTGVDVRLVQGASYIVTFVDTSEGYAGSSTSDGPTVQIVWRKGTEDPLVL